MNPDPPVTRIIAYFRQHDKSSVGLTVSLLPRGVEAGF
jgi:hypothetical protein